MMTSSDETTIQDEQLVQRTEHVHKQLSRLVGQLRNGCGNIQCRRVLCHTGRSNASRHPTRRYTIQAARMIAFDVYTSRTREPESLFCQYYLVPVEIPEIPRKVDGHDTGSLLQSMGNTHVFRQIGAVSPSLHIAHDYNLVRCSYWHQKLDILQGLDLARPRLGEAVSSNAALIEVFVPCLDWLVSQIPVSGSEVLVGVHERINNVGDAQMSSEAHKSSTGKQTEILDAWEAMHKEELLDLLERVVIATANRSSMEIFVRDKLGPADSSPTVADALLRMSEREDSFEVVLLWGIKWSETTMNALRIWLEILFFKYWNGSANLDQAPYCRCILNMISWGLDSTRFLPVFSFAFTRDTFPMPRLALELDAAKAAQIWQSMSAPERRRMHIFHYRTVFDQTQRLTFFRHVNLLTMRKESAESTKSSRTRLKTSVSYSDAPEAVRNAESYFLLLNVSRNRILQDTFDQLWHRRRQELRRPLRVRLGEIDDLDYGTDMGGVQVEFFNLVFRELVEKSEMFVAHEASGTHWLRPGSLHPLHMFELVGILIGLAMYNGITIPIDLPTFFYANLLDLQYVSLKFCGELWPDIAAGLQKLTDDALDGMDFVFPLEANGLRLGVSWEGEPCQVLTVHSITPIGSLTLGSLENRDTALNVESLGIRNAWPGWTLVDAEHPAEPLTPDNKDKFIAQYCHWVQIGVVCPQYAALKSGVAAVFDRKDQALHILTPAPILKELVEGSRHLDIAALRAATKYIGYEPDEELIDWFWEIVTAWPQEKQKKLLQFVTALEKIPFGGEQFVKFVIEERWYYDQEEGKENLPTASTCFGTLGLPRYSSREVLVKKLDMAIEYAYEGFGNG